jgi:hypothetical protein
VEEVPVDRSGYRRLGEVGEGPHDEILAGGFVDEQPRIVRHAQDTFYAHRYVTNPHSGAP